MARMLREILAMPEVKRGGDTMKNRVIQILMNRDELTEEEATEQFEEVKAMIDEAICNSVYEEVENILLDELSLEPDYLPDFLE